MTDTRYVSVLPKREQVAILARLAHLTPTELEDALNSRVCDLMEKSA